MCGWKFIPIKKYICGQTYQVVTPDGSIKELWSGATYQTIHSATGRDSRQYPFRNTQEICDHAGVPDYFNDLNACHEMEKVLTDLQYKQYCKMLDELGYDDRGVWYPNRSRSATAEQRCEAFLMTLGVGEEEE